MDSLKVRISPRLLLPMVVKGYSWQHPDGCSHEVVEGVLAGAQITGCRIDDSGRIELEVEGDATSVDGDAARVEYQKFAPPDPPRIRAPKTVER